MAELSGTGAHLSTAELRVWTSLVDASRILDTELEAQLLADHEMSHREYEVLVRTDGAGGQIRMSALARQIEASAPLVSQTVAKLEARGWIERLASETDRRGVEAALTKAGRSALARAAEPHAALIRSLLIEHLGADMAVLGNALGAVADHLRTHRAGDSCVDDQCPMNAPG